MDLLLIIVFAQFLDVRETAQTQSEDLAIQRQELEKQREFDARKLEQAMRDRNEALIQSRMRLQSAEAALASLAATLQTAKTESGSMGLGADASGQDSIASVEKLAEDLADASPATMARFLVSHAELLKRAEVWNLHAAAGGLIRLSAGENAASFRLQNDTQASRTEEAAAAVYRAFKQLPQTKGLVIVLVSFDLRSRAGVYQPLIDSMPAAMATMAADSPQSRFEYTVLGATPDPNQTPPPETPKSTPESS